MPVSGRGATSGREAGRFRRTRAGHRSVVATRADRPGAQEWVPPDPTLERLRGAVQDCRGCELYADATQAVLGAGPEDAALMLLGEQPGDREDRAGEPFVGPAGELLDRALESAGIDRDEVYLTNVVKHFRFSGSRGKQRIHKTPSRVHVAACEPWLLAELDVVRPIGVVTLGATAGQAIFGKDFRVTELRGRRQDWSGMPRLKVAPAWVVPTVHPSAVLRSRQREEDLRHLVDDLRAAGAALADHH